jgi:uncharacterized membrane protein
MDVFSIIPNILGYILNILITLLVLYIIYNYFFGKTALRVAMKDRIPSKHMAMRAVRKMESTRN